jgi:hypothetical protein
VETKVLVTGLWMGSSEDTENCQVCNYDYSWVFSNPSTLIWADKIILTPFVEKIIENETYPDEGDAIAKVMKKTIETAGSYGIIETRDPSNVITSEVLEKIANETDFDMKLLHQLFPNQVRLGDDRKVPGQFFVGGQEYCAPVVQSIYASLILAKAWNARCLFSSRVFNYCRYKFGTSVIADRNLGQPPNAFDTIFSSYMPEYNIFPEYVYPNIRESKCVICAKENKCSKEYLSMFESNLSKYLEIREYDEVTQIKGLIQDIISRLEFSGEKADHDSVIREFKNEEGKMVRRIRHTFPRVNRWSNIALIASVPATVVGLSTGLPIVSVIGASIAGLSKAANEYVKYLESKYEWIGFTTKDVRFPPHAEKNVAKLSRRSRPSID